MKETNPHPIIPASRPTDAGSPSSGAIGSESGFFEEVEHTADVALRCGGPDLETFFRSAARGLYHLMGITAGGAEKSVPHALALEAEDLEGLLVAWLGELAYLAETRGLVFETMAFSALTPTHVEARLTGRRAGTADTFIKAVTYHGLKVAKTPEGYAATIVFDV